MNEELIQQMDNDIKIIGDKCEEFTSKTGWIISPSFTIPIIEKLFKKNDKDYTDTNLYRYFKRNGNMNTLFNSINELKQNANLKTDSLIDEVIEAYNNGLYKVTMPSLVSVIEGILSEEKKINDNYKKRLSNYCIEKTKQYKKNDVEYVVFKSISKYIENFYQSSYFFRERPYLINRHFIQHGRDDTSLWKEIDSINLFCVLEGLLFVLHQDK